MCDDPECDYDLFRDLAEAAPDAEHPLDRALRTNDMALRCYYWEKGHGAATGWDSLCEDEKDLYKRLPYVDEHRLPSGTYYTRGASGCLRPITETEAMENWSESFRAR